MGEEPPSPAPPAKMNWAARIKTNAETATAALETLSAGLKTVLHGALLCLVLGAAAMLLWREETTRALVIDVSKDAETSLVRHGGDIDLRLALQDALNERLAAVQRIIAVQGLTIRAKDDDAQSVSFKPFGVEVTTDEVTRLTDLLLNRPPPPSVRLELLCAPNACSEPGSYPAKLVATVSGASALHRAAYDLNTGTGGLRRSLRGAIQNTADDVVAQSEPGIASVWFFNRALIRSVSIEQFRLDVARAVGAAVAARPQESSRDCVSDLVIGGSLMKRGVIEEGVAAQRRAAAKSTECRIHGQTNIVLGLAHQAFCTNDAAEAAREQALIDDALAQLPAVAPGQISDLVYLRIPAARLLVETFKQFDQAGGATLGNFCLGWRAPEHGPQGVFADRLAAMMQNTVAQLPPRPSGDALAAIFQDFWFALHNGIPLDDFAGRGKSAVALLDLLMRYKVFEKSPRWLEVIEGQIGMEICDTLVEARQRSLDDRFRLARSLGAPAGLAQQDADAQLATDFYTYVNLAISSFENAKAIAAMPLEDLPNAEIAGMIGDAEMLAGTMGDAEWEAGHLAMARAQYAHVLEEFLAANEPVEQVPAVASAISRWASLRIAAGDCKPGAPADDGWSAAWSPLGVSAPDLCSLAADVPAKKLPTLLGLIGSDLRRCPPETGPAAAQWRAAIRWENALNCLDSMHESWRFAGSSPNTAKIDAEFADALQSQP